MLKVLIASLIVMSSVTTLAAECVDNSGNDIYSNPDRIVKVISSKDSCSEAAELARACAYGSSIDLKTVGAAIGVCDNVMKAYKPSKRLQNLLATMNSTCRQRYARESGTMYQAIEAHCELSAMVWIVELVQD